MDGVLVTVCHLGLLWQMNPRRCCCRHLLSAYAESPLAGMLRVRFSRPAEAIDAEDADLLASLIRVATVVCDSVVVLQLCEPSGTKA